MNKKGFTLVELLAVIVVLAIILAIAVPGISGIIKNSTMSAMKSDARLLLKSIDLKKLSDDTFNPIEYNNDMVGLLASLKLNGDNYESVVFTEHNGKILVTITGKGKWAGLTACGSYQNMQVSEDGCELDFVPPVITLIGSNVVEIEMGNTYTEEGATAQDNKDGDITSSIVVTGIIDFNVEGIYTKIYTVTDSSGNTTTLERTVKVVSQFDELKGVNRPKLAGGMIPIKWVTDHWETTTTSDNDWYEYGTTPETRKWANAIQVTNKSLYSSAGTTVDIDNDVIFMWVWIPRYAYQIEGGYHTSTTGVINVEFLKGESNITGDGSTVDIIPTYSDADTQSNFIKHPVFSFDETEFTGIWVAKFEISGSTTALDSKPNVSSIATDTLIDRFTSSRNMETNDRYGWSLASELNTNGTFKTDNNNVDTHMMKNTEWGAVAYLSKSIYGKNDIEVFLNPTALTTGRGGETANQLTTDDVVDSASPTLYGYDGKSCSSKTGRICTGETHATYGMASSTTGTIYGIYDMAGGRNEIVMGTNNTVKIYGLTPGDIHDKYIDRYSGSNYGYNTLIVGDAVYETSYNPRLNGTGGCLSCSWFSERSYMPYSSYSFFLRGGSTTLSSGGIFDFGHNNVSTITACGWRVVLLVGTGL